MFLQTRERVVPLAALVQAVERYYPRAKAGRPPVGVEAVMRIHYLQQCFALSDPAVQEALHDMPACHELARLEDGLTRLTDETAMQRFRHLLEKEDLATDMLRVINESLQAKGMMKTKKGTVVDITLIAASGYTKHAKGERNPKMKLSDEGNQ